MKISDEQAMLNYGKQLGADFLKHLKQGNTISASATSASPVIVVELLGDVGAGKTTLTRGIASGLGIKTPVTSPSFTISKQYSFLGGTLVHYDFYRLPDPGLMTEDLEESISTPGNIVVIEWADSVEGILPENRMKIQINYNDDGTRNLEIVTDEETH